jgi:ribosomal peptide maturation radical SAM protein 1
MVVLISAPWASVRYPSIQLGTLKAVLDRAGIPCRTHSLALDWLELLMTELDDGNRFTFAEYERIGNASLWWGLADWAFAHPPVRAASAERDAAIVEFARGRGVPDEIVRKVTAARGLAREFLDRAADRLATERPHLIGFSSTYGQNHASLLLAFLLKQRLPDTPIVFGGANCEGPMGTALERLFPWIDAVVSGPGEDALLAMARAAAEGRPIDAAAEGPPSIHSLDDLPIPDYGEYFQTIEGTAFYDDLIRELDVPFETARGCWWGAKHHCTFCGLNGQEMAFRSKSPGRLVDEIRELSSRYQQRRFAAVDNIIDMKYFDHALPALAEQGWDLDIFYETKANLTKPQIKLLRESGVRRIQPGLESLSNAILRLMRKGVTALQNVRLLKWCAEFGVGVSWNIIYGFPDEPVDEYARMAAAAPALFHLEAPMLVPLAVERFSPYQFDSAALGVRIIGPDPVRRLLYDAADDDLMDLSYVFDHAYADGRDPESYVGPLRDAVGAWRRTKEQNGSLRYYVGPGHVEIIDDRDSTQTTRITLEDWRAAVYLSCDAGASPEPVRARLDARGRPSERELASFLHDCLDARIMFEDDNKFLSVAVGTGKLSPGASEAQPESAARKTIALVPAGR